MKRWHCGSVYGALCLIGIFGVVVSFSKVGVSGFFGGACYGAVFMLALNFLVGTIRTSPFAPQRTFFIRSGSLMALALIPMISKLVRM